MKGRASPLNLLTRAGAAAGAVPRTPKGDGSFRSDWHR